MSNSSTGFSERGQSIAFLIWAALALLCALLVTECLLRTFTVNLVPWARQVHQALSTRDLDFMIGDSQMDSSFRQPPPGWTNLSAGGSNVVMIREIALYYARKSRRPDQRIMVLGSPQMFSAEREQQDRGEYERLNIPHLALLDELYSFNPLISRHLVTTVGNWIDRNAARSRKRIPSWNEWSAAKRVSYVQHRAKKQQPLDDFRQGEGYRSYVELLKSLSGLQKKICIFRPPWTSQYMQYVTDRPQFVEVEQELRRLSVEIGASYLDFRELSIDWDDEKLFKDGDHVSVAGSTLLQPRAISACFGKIDAGSITR